ncbi:MAG TPA: type 4a pilus biogenesis protein PilO [Verrucomicrobiae bacterium]|jgi:Tfp pilus assembly protein PilO|nr:type 4a pilus biogenesis protein PilO [Verrucomicrobiae bacterium]
MEIKNRQQRLLVVTLVVAGLYIANLAIYGPLVKWWKSRQADVAELKQEVNDGNALIRRESAIRDKWQHIQSNALANDPSQAEQKVLKAFDSWASYTGVNVESITPQWQNDQNDYSTLDCRVEASGDLETLSRFVYQIENDPMDLQLESVELTASDDKGRQLTLGLQISGLALVTTQ